MDAYTLYLNTMRYVMTANHEDKSTWSDILKYIPCLRQMLSCCVCGNLLKCPWGPVNSVCLHHICEGCVGGKMRLKPSCSWCKDHETFIENEKLRVLVLCFKKLCNYISHSKIRSQILKLSLTSDEPNKDSELLQVLNETEKFTDDYTFTAPTFNLPKQWKISQGRRRTFSSNSNEFAPSTSWAFNDNYNNTSNRSRFINFSVNNKNKKGRGRRRGSTLSKMTVKSSQSTNASIHVKRLKRKAISSVRYRSNTRKPQNVSSQQSHVKSGRFVSRHPPSLLISQRPHRHLSGKCSVGQLWRETFLEEKQPEPEAYPDSGIEIENASDHDHGHQPPVLKHQNEIEKVPAKSDSNENVFQPRGTRLHPTPDDMDNISNNNTTKKSGLTLAISKKQIIRTNRNNCQKVPVNIRDSTDSSSSDLTENFPNKISNLKRNDLKSGPGRSLLKRHDICRCARFKKPNRLTCLGQKCPCYREKKACVDCLCNGCKNPRPKTESVPPLTHVINETSCVQHGIEPIMPRLSPIPRI